VDGVLGDLLQAIGIIEVKFSKLPWLSLLVLYLPHLSAAEGGFAQTGFTGYLRTPDAQVVDTRSIQFGSAWENHVNYNTDYRTGAHHTLMLGVGLLTGLELVVQNTYKNFDGAPGYNAGHGASDLSFSAKLNTASLLPDSPIQFALGVQDYGTHSATYHNNYYAVGQLDLGDFDFSLGYGRGDAKNQMGVNYLNGLFAGARWQVHPLFDVLTDYDHTGLNGGLRLRTPKSWLPDGWRLNTTLQAFSNSSTPDRDNAWLSVGLKIDLGHGTQKAFQTYASSSPFGVTDTATQQILPILGESDASPQISIQAEAAYGRYDPFELLSELKALGLENLRAGEVNGIPLITFENNVYLRNEMTALGAALGIVSQHIDGWYYLVVQSKQIPILALKVHGAALRQAHQHLRRPRIRHIQYLQAEAADLMDDVIWRTETVLSSRWIPRINLSLAQRSTLGTEWGVLDYSTALATNAVFDLGPGTVLDIRHLYPLANSDDAEVWWHPITPYENTFDRILLHQALPVDKNLFSQFSFGKVLDNYVAIINESSWQSTTGQHRFSLLSGFYDPLDPSTQNRNRRTVLGYYRYYFPDAKHGVELFGGRYLNGDAGYGVRTLHWFGDTQVNLELKSNETRTEAGLYFSFPLTTKQVKRYDYFQLTGVDQWRWGYRTQINGTQNLVRNASMVESRLQHNLSSAYFNRDRLSLQYFYANLPIVMDGMRTVISE
jgi:hypothetical protein